MASTGWIGLIGSTWFVAIFGLMAHGSTLAMFLAMALIIAPVVWSWR